MTVSIDIDLDAIDAKMEIGQLKMMLESLDEDLDIDLDLDGDLGDTLDDLTDTMDELSESFNSDLNDTIDRLESLDLEVSQAPDGGGDSGGGTGSDSGDGKDHRTMSRKRLGQLENLFDRDAMEMLGRMGGLSDGGDDSAFTDLSKGKMLDFQMLGGDGQPRIKPNLNADLDADTARVLQSKINSVFGDDFNFALDRERTNEAGKLIGRTDQGLVSLDQYRQRKESGIGVNGDNASKSGGRNSRGRFRGLRKKMRKLNGAMDGLTDGFKRMIPSMTTWMNLMGAAVPALGAMAVQALGVASAFGAIAIAGAGMVGLGLLGEGDTMAESFRNAKEEIGELKKDLFETFEPAADLFSGVQSEFFDFIPQELERVSGSMEGLLVFKDEFFDMFRQLTKFGSQFFDMLASKHDTISELWNSFKGIIGTNLIGFFEFLLEAGNSNESMLKKLGSTLKVVAIAFYEVFVMVSRALIMLSPLFVAIAWGAKLLNNKFVSGMLAALAVMYLLTSVLPSIYLGFQALGFALQRTTIPAIGRAMSYTAGWMSQKMVDMGINYAWAASIAAVSTAILTLAAISGIGLAISATGLLGMGGLKSEMGGSGRNSGGYGSAGGTTNIHNEGDTVNVDIGNAETSTVEKFADMGSGGPRTPVEGSYGG